MAFHVVIPARLGSTRLPRKPLKMIAGKPMIQWVVEAALKSSATDVIVATDAQEVAEAVQRFGGEVCITRADHESGTDRLQEVAQHYQWSPRDVIVNVQGDEPLIPAEVIDQVAANLLANDGMSAATLSTPINSYEQMMDPSAVKVVADSQGKALYFSRAPIPYSRDCFATGASMPPEALAQRHIGIYAYRVALLHEFVQWPLAPMEVWEKLEQLRILFNGHAMHVAPANVSVPAGVDTAEDLERVIQNLEGKA